jgi:H+/Cl- antiporter ClcA
MPVRDLFSVCIISMNLCASRTSVQWHMVNSLFLATVIRTGLVVISYGCKVPAGIFVPSMAIGATFGRMIGIMVKAMYRYALFHLSSCILMLTFSVHIPVLAFSHSVIRMFLVSPRAPMHSSAQQPLSGTVAI